jgi:hypothetical protein
MATNPGLSAMNSAGPAMTSLARKALAGPGAATGAEPQFDKLVILSYYSFRIRRLDRPWNGPQCLVEEILFHHPWVCVSGG